MRRSWHVTKCFRQEIPFTYLHVLTYCTNLHHEFFLNFCADSSGGDLRILMHLQLCFVQDDFFFIFSQSSIDLCLGAESCDIDSLSTLATMAKACKGHNMPQPCWQNKNLNCTATTENKKWQFDNNVWSSATLIDILTIPHYAVSAGKHFQYSCTSSRASSTEHSMLSLFSTGGPSNQDPGDFWASPLQGDSRWLLDFDIFRLFRQVLAFSKSTCTSSNASHGLTRPNTAWFRLEPTWNQANREAKSCILVQIPVSIRHPGHIPVQSLGKFSPRQVGGPWAVTNNPRLSSFMDTLMILNDMCAQNAPNTAGRARIRLATPWVLNTCHAKHSDHRGQHENWTKMNKAALRNGRTI